MVPGEDVVSFVLRKNMLLQIYIGHKYCGEHYDGLPRCPLTNEGLLFPDAGSPP